MSSCQFLHLRLKSSIFRKVFHFLQEIFQSCASDWQIRFQVVTEYANEEYLNRLNQISMVGFSKCLLKSWQAIDAKIAEYCSKYQYPAWLRSQTSSERCQIL